jgi:type I restriction enzyme, S subunit
VSGQPKGWVYASLDDLGAAHSAGVWGADPGVDGTLARVKIVRNGDIAVGGSIRWEALPERALTGREIQKAALHPCDVLVTTSGEVGKTAIWPELPDSSPPRFGASNFVRRIRGTLRSVGPWIHYYLRTTEANQLFKKHARGVAIQNLSAQFWSELRVPVAPRNEQARIVSAIESYFTRLDDAVATLDRVQHNLKRYRASVLKSAVEGRLVPTEAELARVEGRSYEPASVLLTRVLAERRRRWEDAELAKMTAKGKAPKDDRWKAKYVEPVAPDTSELPELPEGWSWATIEQISSLVTDGDHNPPKRTSEGVPHLTAKNVKRWTLTLEGCSFVSAAGYEKTRSRYDPVEGDLIVTCVGTVGECALVPPRLVFSADRNLAAVRLVPLGALTKYVLYFLSSPQTQTTIRRASGSTAQPHLYLTAFRAFAVPLPPRDEQVRIVDEIETLLSVERSTSDIVNGSRVRADRLRQSILKWAFEGRLVDQDPTDEPASVLLDRIRAERASVTDKPPRRARSARAATKQGS